jgi:hypothetical protein
MNTTAAVRIFSLFFDLMAYVMEHCSDASEMWYEDTSKHSYKLNLKQRF